MEPYFIIVGLGNPGRKYDGSRHNVGFDVIDELVDRFHIGGPDRFGKSMIGKGRIGDRKVILVKPLTYMNLSGEAVQEIVHYYKADPSQDLVVISDDIDLEAGHLRLRKKGSAGGHNGLKNIVLHLGTMDFPRIRIGVGAKPDPAYDLADYVLGHFSAQEKKIMDEAVSKAADAVACIVTDGVDLAMNRYNTPRKKKERRPRKDPAAQAGTPVAGDGRAPAEDPASAAKGEMPAVQAGAPVAEDTARHEG